MLAGGSGFLGGALRTALANDGHAVANLTRSTTPRHSADIPWAPNGTAAGDWVNAIDGVDAVVNLAGEGIADARWTDERKRAILDSRLAATRSLVAAMAHVRTPPSVFVSASAIGY